MPVIRIKKTKNYSVISNHHLNNESLSLKAKGLQTYLLSLPDDWTIHVSHLVKTCKDGKRAIYTALKELKKEGYIEHVPIREDNGRIQSWEYIVYEVPQAKNLQPQGVEPQQQNVNADNTKVKTAPVPSTDFLIRTDNTKPDLPEIQKTEPIPEPIPVVVVLENDIVQVSVATDTADVDKLFDLIPAAKQTEVIRNLVITALITHSLAYVQEAIIYTVKRSKGNQNQFKAYLGRCIDKGWARGSSELDSKDKKAVDNKQQEIQKVQSEHIDRIQKQKTEAAEIDLLLKQSDLTELDSYISKQDLNSFERIRFKRGKRQMPRRRYVSDFIDAKTRRVDAGVVNAALQGRGVNLSLNRL